MALLQFSVFILFTAFEFFNSINFITFMFHSYFLIDCQSVCHKLLGVLLF